MELLVDEVAFLPDLALCTGEHVDAAHLHHGFGEVAEEFLGEVSGGLALDVGPGDGVAEQLGVGVEEAPALGHQPVVASVEAEEAAGIHLGKRGVVGEAPAPGPQPRQVRTVERRVDVGGVVGAGEVVKAVAEEVAVSGAKRVAAGEDDEVLDAEALGGEHPDELGKVGGGRGQLVGLVCDGYAAVTAAQRDGPGGALGNDDCVARHEREDVGAGDGARAGLLELVLDPLHRPEAAEGQVRRRVLLRRVVRHRIQQHRPVAAPDEAVMEVEAEQGAGERRRHLEDVRHLLPDDLLHVRARLAVEIHLRPCSHGARGSRRDEHDGRHDQCRHTPHSDAVAERPRRGHG
uniref:Peroxidase 1 n=1 Tax=Arundo donax TaxID=35708 RepID=A0A0A9D7F7_ARUDO